MTDIELLPLPETLVRSGFKSSAEAFARANVAHHTAKLQAEIEALCAEVKSLQTLRDVVIENHGYWKDRAELMEEALRDARVMVEDWAGYASEYLRNKHDLAKADSTRAALGQEGGNG